MRLMATVTYCLLLCTVLLLLPAITTAQSDQDIIQRIEELEQWIRDNPGVFDWNVHNELRHLYGATNPRKSMEHSNVILQHSVMDGYILNILSGWQIGVDSAAARANLLMNAQAFPDLRFIAAACFLKIGDLYTEEGNLEEAESFYLRVAEDTSPDMAQYRILAEERGTETTLILTSVGTFNGEAAPEQAGPQTSFAPGEAIRYAARIKNTGSSTMTASLDYLVTGPKEIFSSIDDIAIPPDPPEGGWSLYATTTVPTDAPSGTYTLRVTMTINGQFSTKESSFTVLGGSEQPQPMPQPRPTPTIQQPPVAPSNVRAVEIMQASGLSTKVSWTDNAVNELGYVVVDQNRPQEYDAEPVPGTGTIGSLILPFISCFRVYAYNEYGRSPLSDLVCPMSRIPKGEAPNLVVLVHGCCTDANGVKEWDELGRLIAGTIPNPSEWEVVVWDWTKDTDDPVPGPAYWSAENQGRDLLAPAILKHSYKYIHMIAHSAGSRLIDIAAKTLIGDNKIKQENPFIHLTFLDAFQPNNDDYGKLAGYSYHYSEHYVNRGGLPTDRSDFPYTDSCLKDAFNFDITAWENNDKDPNDPKSGHFWPFRWYKQSVTTSEFKFGYPLSFGGGVQTYTSLFIDYPNDFQCSLTDVNTKCKTGVSVLTDPTYRCW